MFGLGSLIGGALKIGGSIFGGYKASQVTKQVLKDLTQQQRENQDWYDRRYNEDATQRADAQRMLAMTMDAIRDRYRQAAGTQAVMGGTEESMAATKAANANALSDTASKIAISGLNRKDNVENMFRQRKDQLNEKVNNLKLAKANNIISAVNGVSGAANDIAVNSGLDDIQLWNRKNKNEE